MVRHVISVCIFCFICATHSPCASHATIEHPASGSNNPSSWMENPQISSREKPKINTFGIDENYKSTETIARKKLIKRDSDNVSVHSEDISDYLKKLFLIYGNGNTMSIEGFEKLVHQLNLHKILRDNLDIKLHNTVNETDMCFSYEETMMSIKDQNKSVIDLNTFHMVCPALLYGMISKSCAEDEHNFQVNGSSPAVRNDLTWVYSIVAVFLISACGVLSLAIIPVMQKRFYNQLIQFLVALAVGTLAGDALLHLLPHAMSSNQNDAHQGDHGGHDENTWKGFVAMLGLTFFFIMERLILLTGKWRKAKQKTHSHVTVLNDRQENLNQKNDTQCMDRYNPFPYCYKDIMDNPSKTICESDRTAITVLELDSNSDIQSCQKSRSPTTEKLETNQNMNESTCTEENKMLPPEERHDHEDYTVIVREHKSEHHGHSHKHGHVHAAPQNYSSVAWMVIMGDGLHNFTDGMAIGAAFSEGLAGGFSTTVAVFCHELPHELGDFAMLLKAGMSIKQALFYNILSSLLCLLGSFFGLWIGNTDYASSWVFATAAGMFIYIALVDMIPELSSAHEDEGNLMQCVLHLGGLLLGFGIMTLIALYEHDLKNVFNDPI